MNLASSFQSSELASKYNRLRDLFKTFESVIVAYSGGVDSALLLKIGTDVLNERCIGVIGISPSLSAAEYKHALHFARHISAELRPLNTNEMNNELYIKNDKNRCFYCKHELYSHVVTLAQELKIDFIVDGTNVDDIGDHRPGMNAAKQLKIHSPFLETGMDKNDIRNLARYLDLPVWNKPAQPCLSSRVMYGQRIDSEILIKIDRAEQFVKERGYTDVRVRFFGTKVSVEVNPVHLNRILQQRESEHIISQLKEIGFQNIEIDPKGYKQGKLNTAHRNRVF